MNLNIISGVLLLLAFLLGFGFKISQSSLFWSKIIHGKSVKDALADMTRDPGSVAIQNAITPSWLVPYQASNAIFIIVATISLYSTYGIAYTVAGFILCIVVASLCVALFPRKNSELYYGMMIRNINKRLVKAKQNKDYKLTEACEHFMKLLEEKYSLVYAEKYS